MKHKISSWMLPLCAFAALTLTSEPAHAAATKVELAGNPLGQYPFFEYVKAFNENTSVHVAIDPTRFPAIVGQTCDVYVVAAKKTTQWDADKTLTDVTSGGQQTQIFNGTDIQGNTIQVTAPSELSANAGMDLGVGYDVVLDCDQNGMLSTGDFIDGRNNEAGFYAVHDTTAAGPLAVTQNTYNLSSTVATTYGIPGTHRAQDLFYPTNIASMGQLPIIIVSHGNGHQYIWYDHIGNHLASYGYIVMSHANNTGPGPISASTTTLGHTDALIDQAMAGTIAGGALVGHLDTDRIVWIGHSRGAEGVAVGYDRMFDGTYTPTHYNMADIKLISSMLPTDFEGTDTANPHDANYHLWTASGDADVNGSAGDICGNYELCQTFHLHDRAAGHRQSTVVQGTGHGWFHNNGLASAAFTGPCSIGQANTHLIQLGHFLPLIKRYVEDNIPSIDFLTRQYEAFRPIGVPQGNSCIVVTHEYRDASVNGTFVIDDYQSGMATNISSSGGAVTFDVQNLSEDRLDDNNNNFTWTNTDPFNGATQAGATDTYPTIRNDNSRGVVFDWTGMDRFYEWEVLLGERDFTDNLFLSLRGAQGTRHPNTLATLGDLTFDVTLRDSGGLSSSINIGAFGGGLEQPYARSGGWHNEMETIRIRLTDFLNNGPGLDLGNIVAVRLDVGPSHGSPEGRIVVDDLTLTNDRAVYDGKDNGDPHITTLSGINYDFHSAGEFVLLQDIDGMEIQARQSPISTSHTITNPHTGLASCVSINTAVAARVGGAKVSYQPNISGNPDPSGLQLRIDGALTDIQALQNVDLGGGGRVSKSPAGEGIEIDFPNGTTLTATAHWWNSQQKWYMNLNVFSTPATAGVMGVIPAGDWLPPLPDGTSMGPRPEPLPQRHIDLNKTFADAWRVKDDTSLFDYAPGTSTATFSNPGWPPENPPCEIPESPRTEPVDRDTAVAACRGIINRNDKDNCIFDVALTGELDFAKAYALSQKIEAGSTRITVFDDKDPSMPGDTVTFTAVVKHTKSGQRVTTVSRKREAKDRSTDYDERTAGTVQFTLNGENIGKPVRLNAFGRASWTTSKLTAGRHDVGAIFKPDEGSVLLPNTSRGEQHTVRQIVD